MIDANLNHLLLAAFLFTLFCPLYLKQRKKKPFSLFLPNLGEFELPRKSLKVRLVTLPAHLLLASVLFFFSALPEFTFFLPTKTLHTEEPKEGLALFLVIDRSSSMAEQLSNLEQVTTRFIEDRPSDLFGLTAFARSAEILSPLTLDHAFVIEKLQSIRAVQNPKESASSIGYALYKTANMIDSLLTFSKKQSNPTYTIKSPTIILLTDGFQFIHPDDRENPLRSLQIEEAAEFLKEKGITLYILNVNREFNLDSFDAHRRISQDVAEFTGGKLLIVSDEKGLHTLYKELETKEKSFFIPPSSWGTKKIETRNDLMQAGLFCLVAAILLQTTWLRRIP